MKRGPPPPMGSAPAVSRDIVNTVKKKLAAPSSAPPPSMNVKSIINRGTAYGGLDEDDEDENDDDVSDYEDNEPPHEFLQRRDSTATRTSSFNEENPLNNGYNDGNRGKSNQDNNLRKNSVDNSRSRSNSDERYNDNANQREYDEWGKGDRENSGNNSRQGRFAQPKQGRNRHDDDDDYNDNDYRGSNDGSHDYESDRNASNNSNKNRLDNRDNRDNLKSDSENRSINPGHAANKKDFKDTDREGRPPISNSASLKSDAKANRNTAPVSKGAQGAPRSGKLQMYNFQPILKATYRELRGFVLLPCEIGITTRCYIERTKGPGNMFSPIYSLCADLEDGTGRELMVCRKVLQSMSSHYVFSLKSEDLYRRRDQRSRLFLGKLRSTSSSEYVLYDNGMIRSTAHRDNDNENDEEETTEKTGEVVNSDEVSLFRKEIAVIHYNTKKRPAPLGVRGCEVCVSKGSDDSSEALKNLDAKEPGAYVPGQCLQQPFEKIRDAGKQNQMLAKKCYIMHEKTSRYDPLSSCLVDFKGRANMASVKNFQLVESYCTNTDARKDQEMDADTPFILQVGKTTDECFNMDYRHPLSMLQAFAIAIARFDAKLFW